MAASLKLTALLALAAAVHCNDLRSGFNVPRHRVIFEQTYDYKPSVFVRSENVVVEAHGGELISQIEVIDKRELKDGVAEITSGGIGQSSVAISLKSPAVFRGMTFTVRVWAVDYAEYRDYESGNHGMTRPAQDMNAYRARYNAESFGKFDADATRNGEFSASYGNGDAKISYGNGDAKVSYGNGDAKVVYGTKNSNYGYEQQQYEDLTKV